MPGRTPRLSSLPLEWAISQETSKSLDHPLVSHMRGCGKRWPALVTLASRTVPLLVGLAFYFLLPLIFFSCRNSGGRAACWLASTVHRGVGACLASRFVAIDEGLARSQALLRHIWIPAERRLCLVILIGRFAGPHNGGSLRQAGESLATDHRVAVLRRSKRDLILAAASVMPWSWPGIVPQTPSTGVLAMESLRAR